MGWIQKEDTALKKAVLVMILLLAAGACATVVMGQGPGAPGPGGARAGFGGGYAMCPANALMPPRVAMLDRVEGLGLTADQKSKLTTLLTNSDTTLTPLRQKAAQATQALRTALLAPTYDEAKVARLATEAQNAETALMKAEIPVWTQIRGILTADQVSKLQAPVGRGTGGAGGAGRAGRAGRGAQPAPGQ